MKITTKDKKLLLVASGLVLFLVVYMYVFTPLQEKSDSMQNQIASLERECRELESQNLHIEDYENQISEYKTSITESIKQFPVDVKEEDIIVYLLNLQKANDIKVSSIAFKDPLTVVDFDGVMDVDGEDKMVHMHGEQISASTSTQLSYAKLKQVLKYIYEVGTQTTLESVTVVYNSNNNLLNGTFDFSRYTLTYDDAVYTPEQIPGVVIGQEDVFGKN